MTIIISCIITPFFWLVNSKYGGNKNSCVEIFVKTLAKKAYFLKSIEFFPKMGYNKKDFTKRDTRLKRSSMDNLKKTIEEMEKVIGKKIRYCEESQAVLENGVTCFRFSFQGKNYVGRIEGTDEVTVAFAALLPARIEGGCEEQKPLSKTHNIFCDV